MDGVTPAAPVPPRGPRRAGRRLPRHLARGPRDSFLSFSIRYHGQCSGLEGQRSNSSLLHPASNPISWTDMKRFRQPPLLMPRIYGRKGCLPGRKRVEDLCISQGSGFAIGGWCCSDNISFPDPTPPRPPMEGSRRRSVPIVPDYRVPSWRRKGRSSEGGAVPVPWNRGEGAIRLIGARLFSRPWAPRHPQGRGPAQQGGGSRYPISRPRGTPSLPLPRRPPVDDGLDFWGGGLSSVFPGQLPCFQSAAFIAAGRWTPSGARYDRRLECN